MITVKSFTFSPVQENTYILYNEKGSCLIIDPGCYFPDERSELTAFMDKNALKPEKLLNTHCHLDHVFGNRYIAETYALILHLHKEEQKMLEMAPSSGIMFDLPF